MENLSASSRASRDVLRILEGLRSSGNLPMGFRFRPTDVELVDYYLNGKIKGSLRWIDEAMIPQAEVYKSDPWDLARDEFCFQKDDQAWHFFSMKDPMHPNGKRHNRATRNGFWKATGEDRTIKESPCSPAMGKKKTLVFYRRSYHKSIRTFWTIHEYSTTKEQDSYVLCRLLKKHEEVLLGKNMKTKQAISCTGNYIKDRVDEAPHNSISPIPPNYFQNEALDGASFPMPASSIQGSTQVQSSISELQPIVASVQSLDSADSATSYHWSSKGRYWHNDVASSSGTSLTAEAEAPVGDSSDDIFRVLNSILGSSCPDDHTYNLHSANYDPSFYEAPPLNQNFPQADVCQQNSPIDGIHLDDLETNFSIDQILDEHDSHAQILCFNNVDFDEVGNDFIF